MRESLMGGDTDMNGNQSIFAPFQTCNTMTPISNVKALCKAGATMESMKRSKVVPPMSNNEKQESQNQHCATEYQFKRLQKDQGSSSPQPASTTNTLLKTEPAHKVKFSERVSTLQQLVSPYGKTDTASVLQEAIGYIKFLHDQVQALSIPYLKSPTNHNGDHCNDQNEEKIDLKSRGLCLVPISCTIQVTNDNGADYWYSGSIR
ncbi:hypothetical protein KP509_33G028900 [Ceratopteris richardii]|uniref:BHLH domain-containing protein n=1 Tax=Ceratopteris richardii TaxID=49495 RepID=A0A8T2QNQ9_CERRI|nr:hypothetical protein KP509_33G028900 [Ceratopteris richardii]